MITCSIGYYSYQQLGKCFLATMSAYGGFCSGMITVLWLKDASKPDMLEGESHSRAIITSELIQKIDTLK